MAVVAKTKEDIEAGLRSRCRSRHRGTGRCINNFILHAYIPAHSEQKSAAKIHLGTRNAG